MPPPAASPAAIPPMLLVELCGVPGAGKTTLRPVLEELLAARGYAVRSPSAAVDARVARWRVTRLLGAARLDPGLARRRGRRWAVDLPWAVAGALRHPRLAVAAVRAVLANPVGLRHRAVLVQRFALPLATRTIVGSTAMVGEAVIVDEGLVHRAVNLFGWRVDRPRRGELERYGRLVPVPDLLVAVRASPAVARRRLAERGLPRYLRRHSPERVERFLANAEAALAVTIEAVRQRGGAVIDVNNDGTHDEARAALAMGLDEHLGGWARRTHARPTPFIPTLPVSVRRPDRGSGSGPVDADHTREIEDVLAAYGLAPHGSMRSVGRGRSSNVLASVGDRSVLVKRYKASVGDDAIASEHAVLSELERLAVSAPRLLRDLAGDTTVRRGAARYAVFEAIEDSIAAHERIAWPGEATRLARRAGETLAGLHAALEGFRPPVANPIGIAPAIGRIRPTAWYADELHRVARLPDAGPRDLVASATWIERRLCETGATLDAGELPITVVHGDYGPYNLLVRPGAPLVPVDFELARPDWRLLDLATAVPRFAAWRLGFSSRRATVFLDAYAGRYPIAVAELRLLPAMAEYLALRRLIVCWARAVDAADAEPLDEARTRLSEARRLEAGSHPLAGVLA